MIILENNTAKLNDIVFENRNKSYGAYAIRSTYDNTLLKSLGITGLIFASISLIAMALNNTSPVENKLDPGTNLTTTTISCPFIALPPEKIEINLPKQHTSSGVKTIAVNTIIKDETTQQKKDPIQTIESSNGIEGKKTDPDDMQTTGGGNSENPEINNPTSGMGKSVAPEIAPDVMPSLENMASFLQKNLKYPNLASSSDVSGKVIVNYIIDEEGKIISATILKGIGYGCDEEALRVIKLMPKWKPGMKNGKPIKVSFSQAIIFTLQ